MSLGDYHPVGRDRHLVLRSLCSRSASALDKASETLWLQVHLSLGGEAEAQGGGWLSRAPQRVMTGRGSNGGPSCARLTASELNRCDLCPAFRSRSRAGRHQDGAGGRHVLEETGLCEPYSRRVERGNGEGDLGLRVFGH